MAAEAHLWHYAIAGLAFVLFGAVGHISRAIFNIFPDRLSDKPWMDMLISDGYSFGDYLFGTEYDEAGYYELYSLKNLRMYVIGALGGGWCMMLVMPGVSGMVAGVINQAAAALWDLFLYRLQNVHLF